MEKISVIVPVYGVEKYLDRCIESIVNQTYYNLEIFLINDASPDNCGKMCDEWAKRDSRIKVIHKEINEGQGLTRNIGLKLVTGEYVTFIDSDDWMGPTHIQDLYEAIKAKNADISIGGYTRAFSDGRRQTYRNGLNNNFYENEEIINNILLSVIAPDINYLSELQVESSIWSNLYDVKLFKEYGIEFISERYVVGEDFFFNMWCLYYSKSVVVADTVEYFYFLNLDSTSNKYRHERFDRTVNFYNQPYPLSSSF